MVRKIKKKLNPNYVDLAQAKSHVRDSVSGMGKCDIIVDRLGERISHVSGYLRSKYTKAY